MILGRRGPKKQDGAREPNGQLSRREEEVSKRISAQIKDLEREERDMMAPAVDARTRVWGIPISAAVQPMAATYVGRLCLQKDINRTQYDAAMLYAEQARDYRIAMRAPPEPDAVNLNRTQGGSGDYENVKRTQRAYSEYELAMKALVTANMEPSNRGCNLIGALDATVIRDVTLDHLKNDMRAALNVLVRHYGLAGQRRAA